MALRRDPRRAAAGLLATGLLAAGLLAAGAAPASAQLTCAPCAIGVVFDGPWARNDEMRVQFEREIADLAGPRFTVVFPEAHRRTADWTTAGVAAAVEALLADPAVDLVLTLGQIGSSVAVNRGDLPKPVVAPIVDDPEAHGYPIVVTDDGDRVSGTPNLSYLALVRDAADELRRLQEVVPFARLAYLVSAPAVEAAPALAGNLQRSAAEAGAAVEIVRVGDSVDAALAALPPEVDAVYVMPLLQLPPDGFARLVEALIARRLPAFSYFGRSEVDQGLLASLYRDTDIQRLGRRIALNVQRILAGEPAAALPIDFRRGQRLSLNMATARAIGVHPGWGVMTEAELLHDVRPNIARRLTLASAAREAVAANLDLAASDRFVAAGLAAILAARGALRPQLSAGVSTETIDRDRAEGSLGLQPLWRATGALSVSQLLYSDGARANVEIQRHQQAAREQSRDDLRLDIAHAAAVGYLDVLRAKTFERIQRENLTVTRSNLELAQSRRRIGVARAAEVIRWENEIATNRRDVIEASARRNVAEIALNRLAHRPLEEPFETADVDLHDPSLLASAAAHPEYVGNPFAFDIFRDFMAQEGLAQAPALRQLDASIAAQARTVLAARRAVWAPTVAAEGSLSVTGNAGTGLTADATADLPFEFTPPDALNWTIGVSASIPVFAGGTRRAERTGAERALDELRLTRSAAAEQIEQRIRSTLHLAGASYAGIDLADDAARAARRNLDLVTDAYEQGVVSILDLIDAQNAALVAEQVGANAVYDYLIDLMDVQRAIGRFGFFMDPGELAAFTDRLRGFFDAAGAAPPGRQ